MQIKTIVSGSFFSNCYLILPENTRESVMIDPGMESGKVLEAVKGENAAVKYIICTHGHIDHIGAAAEVIEALSPSPLLLIHSGDKDMLLDPELNLAGFAGIEFSPLEPDIILKDGDRVTAGEIELSVIHTPGHSPGSICLLSEGVVFTGDTLFASGVGRTDFPGGSKDVLINSIQRKLMPLGPDSVIYPGHGPDSTIGREKQSINEWI